MMDDKTKVFLTDTHWRTAYYTCKSLARKGLKVVGLKSVDSIYDKSKYYYNIISVPSLETHPDRWLRNIEQVLSRDEILIPVSINAVKLVAENHARLAASFTVPAISVEQISIATNKMKSIRFMQNIGVPTPQTFIPKSKPEVENIIAKLGFPLVTKLPEERNIAPVHRYGIAKNEDQFWNLYQKLSVLQSTPLLQEYIQGVGVGISMLCDQGRILALFSHKRLREEMVDGGPSTYCKPANLKVLEQYAVAFADASKWNGIAMLEFKYNPADNTFCFMEINPRFWGSMELAIKCGVDFPFLYFQWITGDIDTNVVVRKSKDIKLKYIGRDIRAFKASLASLDRISRFKMLIFYLAEYFDLRLRYGTICDARGLVLRELFSNIRKRLG